MLQRIVCSAAARIFGEEHGQIATYLAKLLDLINLRTKIGVQSALRQS